MYGFLCKSDCDDDFENGEWIKITCEIAKGYYYGDIPILNITDIEHTQKPENDLVNPPSDSYVPTAVIY